MKDEITIKDTQNGKEFIFNNHYVLGIAGKDVDGFYYFWFTNATGAWDAWILRDIADKLDSLNQPWKDKINEDHKNGLI